MIETNDAIINIDTIINLNSTNSECPICFDSMTENDPILILDCCLKKVHISCIMEWYSKRPNNIICFMCNQTNNFCKDITYDTSYNEIIDETEVRSSSTQHENLPNITINTRHKYNIIKITLITFIIGVACWMLILTLANN